MAALQETVFEPYVFFSVGRMNPPTPGHIDGLCIKLFEKAKEKAIERLAGTSTEKLSLKDLLAKANVKVKIYITNTANVKTIQELNRKRLDAAMQRDKYTKASKEQQELQLREWEQKFLEEKDALMKTPINVENVKSQVLKNPLEPPIKKIFIEKMLEKTMLDERRGFNLNPEDITLLLKDVVTITQDMFSGIDDVKLITGDNNLSNLSFVIGKDEGEENGFEYQTRMAVSSGFVDIDNHFKLPSKLKVDPVPDSKNRIHTESINRTKIIEYNTFASSANRGAEDTDDSESMSASFIRLLIAGIKRLDIKDTYYNKLNEIYKGYLNEDDIDELIYYVKEGIFKENDLSGESNPKKLRKGRSIDFQKKK